MCVCVCVCVGSCLLTLVLLTHPHSQQSLSTLSVPCRMPLSGNKNENKMLTDFKKLQGSVRYRSQGTKHVTGAIFYFNHDKIQLTIFKWTVWCSVHSHCCATKLENFFFLLHKTEILTHYANNSPLSLPPVPGDHHPTSCFLEFDYSRNQSIHSFCVWLISFSTMASKFIYRSEFSSFLRLNNASRKDLVPSKFWLL